MRKDIVLGMGDHVAVLTLNRPPANLIDVGLLTALDKSLDKAVKDEAARVIVVAGSDSVFCEGLDLGAFEGMSSDERRELVRKGQELFWKFEHSPKPTIAAMAGRVMNAGLELALCCDMRLASEDSHFGHTEVSEGLVPMFGNTFRLERLIGRSRARSLIFFGEPIPAWEAFEIGLIGRVVPQGALLEEARIAARRIASQPPEAIQSAKRAFLAAEEKGCKESLEEIQKLLSKLRHRRNR